MTINNFDQYGQIKRICRICKTTLFENDKYCASCGESVDGLRVTRNPIQQKVVYRTVVERVGFFEELRFRVFSVRFLKYYIAIFSLFAALAVFYATGHTLERFIFDTNLWIADNYGKALMLYIFNQLSLSIVLLFCAGLDAAGLPFLYPVGAIIFSWLIWLLSWALSGSLTYWGIMSFFWWLSWLSVPLDLVIIAKRVCNR